MLTEKLMKLRASRQDIEAELFGLKDKRIKLLEVINKLEDEEMQLVSEVSPCSRIAVLLHTKQATPFCRCRGRGANGVSYVSLIGSLMMQHKS